MLWTLLPPDPHEGHTPGDGYGPDVDPVTGDEAETERVNEGDAMTARDHR